jgi:ribosomal protein L7/L12
MRDIDLGPYQRMLANGCDIEDVLARLRRDGHSRIESIKILVALRDCSLKEAKQIVHTSDAWADARQSAEDLTGLDALAP